MICLVSRDAHLAVRNPAMLFAFKHYDALKKQGLLQDSISERLQNLETSTVATLGFFLLETPLKGWDIGFGSKDPTEKCLLRMKLEVVRSWQEHESGWSLYDAEQEEQGTLGKMSGSKAFSSPRLFFEGKTKREPAKKQNKKKTKSETVWDHSNSLVCLCLSLFPFGSSAKRWGPLLGQGETGADVVGWLWLSC